MSTPWWYEALRRLSERPGAAPAERAAIDRVSAGMTDIEVARLRLEIAADEASGAMRDFAAAWEAIDLRDRLDEAEEVATHPDLVELNVTMDGWYGA